ncbi:hypothetical protein G6O67_006888 [Ophiocordyceps sinensis]|uniref:Uncharacterized protein n=1 Tax=Ophiocordyceps sinensis TaxID=72228 RepID=A0A8H4LXG3_9HYPO|nr:hypothetical protein G6O67_006888 [Ophiocordyceps sinensis]
MGFSDASPITISAATMPPIEWPTSTVLTDGSTVGDVVPAATSKSMTLSSSLSDARQHLPLRLGTSGQDQRLRTDAPASKAAHAASQVPPRLILGVHEHAHMDLWQPLRHKVSQVLRELVIISKRRLVPLCFHSPSAGRGSRSGGKLEGRGERRGKSEP